MKFVSHLPGVNVVGCVFALLFCACSAQAKAEFVLAGWDFNGQAGHGLSPLPASETFANATVGSLTRGGGLTTAGPGPGNAWGGTNWNTGDLAAAIAASDFATFSLTPTSGNFLSYTQIAPYSILLGVGPNDPPTTGQWQFQVGAGDFTNIGTEITWGSSGIKAAIDLSSIAALQNTVQTVTFRLVSWGGENGNGSGLYFDDFQTGSDLRVMGTPEPTSLVLAGMVGAAGLAGSRFSRRKKKLKGLLSEKSLAGE